MSEQKLDIVVSGSVEAGFEPVISEFQKLFLEMNEQGAALSVYKGDQTLVNICAGTRDKSATLPWTLETRANCFSVSKGLVAIAIIQLLERGWLDLEAPIAEYWEEFGDNGKEQITVAQLMCHNTGLSAFHNRMKDQDIYDWDKVIATLEQETPWWPPGTEQGYSPFLYGWLAAELVCRISGVDNFNDYFQQYIAGPLDANCQFGIAESEQENIADMGPLKVDKGAAHQGSSSTIGELMKADPKGVVNRAFTNPMTLMLGTNTPEWRAAQVPAANGHCSAQGLAKIYGQLAVGGGQLLMPNSMDWCWNELSSGHDKVLNSHLRFGCGFMLAQPERADCRFGLGSRGFGHPGAGGSLAFACPETGTGFAYVTNRMGQGLLADPRAQRLIDCFYSLAKRL